ncbi:hypothetical protein FRX31_001978 [Thalictrum thalictroides]|uniref:RNase H type-1 domain-containing protein n=1 Tax=Thalictrum thalictroides TaxID=46969 RepID=A0A7J6XF53_THATH|nr:hypothetical protein FRX31_001978 [Thalictrum thalictroides]
MNGLNLGSTLHRLVLLIATSYITLTWDIWKYRCITIFQNKIIDVRTVADCFRKNITEIMNVGERSSDAHLIGSKIHQTIWIPPDLRNLKVNVDIKFTSPNERFGAGFICRDSKGLFTSAGTCTGSAGSSEQAECSGILSAIKWAKQQGVKRMEL